MAVNYDPYPLAFVRDLIGNYPSSIQLTVPAAEHIPVRSTPQPGHSRGAGAGRDQRLIAVPLGVSARALPDKPKRGYIQSFNFTLQSELPGGFTGQTGLRGRRGSATSTKSWMPTPGR